MTASNTPPPTTPGKDPDPDRQPVKTEDGLQFEHAGSGNSLGPGTSHSPQPTAAPVPNEPAKQR